MYSRDAVFVAAAICYHRLIVYSNNDAVSLLRVVMQSLSERRDIWDVFFFFFFFFFL